MSDATVEKIEDGETDDKLSIHDELLEAVKAGGKFKPKPRNNPAGYLQSIVEGISELPEEQFDALSAEAQAWFNTAAEAFNQEQAIPDLPGFVPEEAPTKGKHAKVGKETGKEGKGKAAKEPKERQTTAGDIIRGALVENQKATDEHITSLLAKAGIRDVSKATLNTYKTHAVATLKVAAALGKFAANPAA